MMSVLMMLLRDVYFDFKFNVNDDERKRIPIYSYSFLEMVIVGDTR